jgi:hypothetical protein
MNLLGGIVIFWLEVATTFVILLETRIVLSAFLLARADMAHFCLSACSLSCYGLDLICAKPKLTRNCCQTSQVSFVMVAGSVPDDVPAVYCKFGDDMVVAQEFYFDTSTYLTTLTCFR